MRQIKQYLIEDNPGKIRGLLAVASVPLIILKGPYWIASLFVYFGN